MDSPMKAHVASELEEEESSNAPAQQEELTAASSQQRKSSSSRRTASPKPRTPLGDIATPQQGTDIPEGSILSLLNTGGVKEIGALKGVGLKTAESIVALREQNGQISNFSDLDALGIRGLKK